MKYYIIDAFADEPFSGNPAGVCLCEQPLSDDRMQKIAFENNLAETAFLFKAGDSYNLRWFTPEVEIDLCGHATLASAYVIMHDINPSAETVQFQTKSGLLSVDKKDNKLRMNFPSRKPVPCDIPAGIEAALGVSVLETHLSRDLLVLVKDEQIVANLQPDFQLLRNSGSVFAVIVTAKGEKYDFVSRFFAPDAGIPEDPVTGSSHCTLIPFWSERLHKSEMTARQLSKRGGTLYCRDCGDRVEISGTARCYLKGDIVL